MKLPKFQIQELLGIGLTLVVLGIALAYGLQVMGDVSGDLGETSCSAGPTGFETYTSWNATSRVCYDPLDSANTTPPQSQEYNASTDAMSGVAKIPEKLPTIATVIVAAVIIGILVTYLWARFQG